MPRFRSALLITALLYSVGAVAQEPPTEFVPLVDTFAEPILVGMKLALAKNLRQGKVGLKQYQCIQRLQPPVLRVPVYGLLVRFLSEEELVDAQRFYASEIGRKYAKYGILQIYSSVGEQQPEADPDFTNQDERALKSFADRPAGRKLIREQVLQQAATRQALAPTVNGLVRECMSAQ